MDQSNGLRVQANRIPGDTTCFPYSVQQCFVISFLSPPSFHQEKCLLNNITSSLLKEVSQDPHDKLLKVSVTSNYRAERVVREISGQN